MCASLLAFVLVPPLAAAAGGPTVRGRILDPAGRPAAGVAVTLESVESLRTSATRFLSGAGATPVSQRSVMARTTTGADGRYALSASDVGFYVLTVRAPHVVAQQLQLAPFIEDRAPPELRLTADAGLAVRVVAPGGGPAAGVLVSTTAVVTERGAPREWQPPERVARTGADGIAHFERGANETLSVRAATAAFAAAENPAVREAAVTLALGAAPSRTVVLRGPQGEALAGALVLDGRVGLPLGRTASDGSLSVAVGPGEERALWALADGCAPFTFTLASAGPPTAAAGSAARAAAAEPLARGVPDSGARAAQSPEARALAMRVADTRTLVARGRVEGRVLDAASRLPVAGALVWVDAGEPTRADGQGRYALFVDGPSAVTAAAPGYMTELDFSHAGSDQGGTLLLTRAAAVAGRVVDARQHPLAGAAIVLEPDLTVQPSRSMMMRFSVGATISTESDAAGRFRIAGVDPAGLYLLGVRRRGYAPASLQVRGVGGDTAAQGASPGLTVTLTAGVGAELAVADPQGRPVPGATATLDAAPEGGNRQRYFSLGREPAPENLAQTDAAGRARWEHLAPGRYDVAVRAAGYAPLRLPGVAIAAPKTPGRRAALGSVRLSPAAVLEGTVVDLDQHPLAEVTITLAESETWRRGTELAGARSAADGSFRIPDLAPGVRLDLKASRQGLSDVQLSGVDVPSTAPLRLVMAPLSRVRGRTLDADGKPVSAALISAQAVRATGLSSGAFGIGAETKSDALGEFVLSDVPSGRIDVTARLDGMVPATLSGLEVQPGRDLEGLELVLRPAGTVRGTVYGAEGEPLPGAGVMAGDMRQARRVLTSDRSDGDGHYRLSGVEPGQRTIVAYSDTEGTVTASLEVKPGDNLLDLRFKGGVEVSGSVVDEQGAAVEAAQVTLYSTRRTSGVMFRNARSDAAGRFVLRGVREGEYRLQAEAPNHATAALDAVAVAAQPVTDLVLRLRAGSAVVGALRGLDLTELGRLSISASRVGASMSHREGAVDPTGRYRVSNAEPGEWVISAWVQGGRHTSGRVVVPDAPGETTLDLEFRDGFALSGTVLRGGAALAGAEVLASGNAEGAEGDARTGADGRFRIEGLPPAKYEVDVYTPRGGAHRELELAADAELEIAIAVGAIRGRALDAADGSVLAGVAVSLEPSSQNFPFRTDELQTATDSRGAYRLGDVAAGDWTVLGNLAGYATARATVTVPEDATEVEAELRLERTDGLRLELQSATGPVAEVMLTVLGADGGAVASGPFIADERGAVRLSTVAPGSYEVLVSANGTAVATARATVPGPAVAVRLGPSARLAVEVPDLAPADTDAVVRVFDAGGTPFRAPSYAGARSQWRMRFGKADVDGLPPGVWSVQVEATDGRLWNATVTAPAGATTPVVPQAR